MSGTVLEHPLVRDYLRRLDAACAALPGTRELHDQITAHLDEALSPAATGDVHGAPARSRDVRSHLKPRLAALITSTGAGEHQDRTSAEG